MVNRDLKPANCETHPPACPLPVVDVVLERDDGAEPGPLELVALGQRVAARLAVAGLVAVAVVAALLVALSATQAGRPGLGPCQASAPHAGAERRRRSRRRASWPPPSSAECNREIFLQSLKGTVTPPAAHAVHSRNRGLSPHAGPPIALNLEP